MFQRIKSVNLILGDKMGHFHEHSHINLLQQKAINSNTMNRYKFCLIQLLISLFEIKFNIENFFVHYYRYGRNIIFKNGLTNISWSR